MNCFHVGGDVLRGQFADFSLKTIRRVQKAIGIVRSRSSLDLQKLFGYFGPSSDPGFPQNSGRSKTSVWNIKPHYQLDGSVRRSWGGTLGAIRWPADRSAGRPTVANGSHPAELEFA